jgi:splicing factor 3B subunit 2
VDEQTLEQFASIFKHFQVGNAEEVTIRPIMIVDAAGDVIWLTFCISKDGQAETVDDTIEGETNTKDENENDNDEEEGEDGPLSKKKMKKINRLSVAELKQLVDKPDVVEVSAKHCTKKMSIYVC